MATGRGRDGRGPDGRSGGGLSRDLIARAFQGAMQRRRIAPLPPPAGLNDLLDRVEAACAHAETVSCQAILDQIGQRSFGALLLLPSVVVVSPLSGIIGLPTAMALMILLLAGQMVLGRREAWVPRRLCRHSLGCHRLHRAMRLLRRPARFVDRLFRPRLTGVTQGLGTRAIAATCMVLALCIPPLEMLPFSTTIVAAVIAVFALTLVANDGAMAILGYVLTLGLIGSAAGLLGAAPELLRSVA